MCQYKLIELATVVTSAEGQSYDFGCSSNQSIALKRITKQNVTCTEGEWRKLHNEELNDLYTSRNIVRVINSRRMRWAGHVARMGGGEAYTGFWWGNLRKRDHLGDPGVDGRIILRWIFRKWDVSSWTGWSWLRIGTGGVHL
jgi:hypothetical protein